MENCIILGHLTIESSPGLISNLVIAAGAGKSEISVESEASVNTADVNAESRFSGTGTITLMNANANGITYAEKPISVVTNPQYKEPQPVRPDSEATFNPTDGALNVTPDAVIVITFKTAMTLRNGKEISKYNISDFVELREESSSGKSVNYNASIDKTKTVIKITPLKKMLTETKYFVTIPANRLKDAGGSGNDAISVSFTTGIGKDFVTFSPAAKTANVLTNVKPTITFTAKIETSDGKEITASFLSNYIIIFREGDDSGTRVDFAASYNSESGVLSILPFSALSEGQTYYLGITENTIRTVKGKTPINGSAVWTTGTTANTRREEAYSAPPDDVGIDADYSPTDY
jgi:hypothetical protein